MAGGKSGGGGQISQDLADISKEIWATIQPAMTEAAGQTVEGLKTGGIGAAIPLITRALEQSKMASSRSMGATESRLAQTGLSGTPFGENILAGTRMQGDLATSQVAPGINMQLLQALLPAIVGQTQQVTTGMTGAGNVANQAQQNAMAPWMRLIPNVSLGF